MPQHSEFHENERPVPGQECPEVSRIRFIGVSRPSSRSAEGVVTEVEPDIYEDVDADAGPFPVEGSPRVEVFRETLARRLLWLVTFEIAALILGVGLGRLSVDDAERMASLFVSPTFAVLAGCVGYFYGRAAVGKRVP